MTPLLDYLPALLLTVAVEAPLAAALAPRGRRAHLLATALCLNLVTHPLATLAVCELTGGFLLVELAVVAAEAVGYRAVGRLTPLRAAALALVANAVTALCAVLWW